MYTWMFLWCHSTALLGVAWKLKGIPRNSTGPIKGFVKTNKKTCVSFPIDLLSSIDTLKKVASKCHKNMAVSSHFDEVCNVLNVCGSYGHYITTQPFSAFTDKKQHNYIPRSSNLYFCVCIIISIDRTTEAQIWSRTVLLCVHNHKYW